MNTWKTYAWTLFADTPYAIAVAPPCGVGPFTVKARSTREAARKFWAAFSDIVQVQLCGLSTAEYQKMKANRARRG